MCEWSGVCEGAVIGYVVSLFIFVKKKTAYEMRISDWSSDVCSSDLRVRADLDGAAAVCPALVASPAAGPVAGYGNGGDRLQHHARRRPPGVFGARKSVV